MCIEIKLRREVTGKGELGYRVLKIKALSMNKLPDMYLQKDTHVYMKEGTGNLYHNNNLFLIKGVWYSKEEWAKKEKFITECGDTLRKVNEHLKNLREKWNGEVVIKI